MLFTQVAVQACVNPSIDQFLCNPVFSPIDAASVGTTIWIDAGDSGGSNLAGLGGTSSFDDFAARITNGTPDWVVQAIGIGAGGTTVGGPEAALFGASAGPSGVDLAGYAIHRIGFRVDSLSLVSPGSDPNGTGIWTDFALQGTFVFEGTIANRDACKGGGWQSLRGPGGASFKSEGDCVSFVATGRLCEHRHSRRDERNRRGFDQRGADSSCAGHSDHQDGDEAPGD